MTSAAASRDPSYFAPRLPYWAQFETIEAWDAALLMKGIEPHLASELPDWADNDISHELKMLMSAVREGVVKAHMDAGGAPTWHTQISVRSFIDWLRPRGYNGLADDLEAARTSLGQSGSPTGSANTLASTIQAQNAVYVPSAVAATSGPAPLTTNEIAIGFDGLRQWDADRWKKALGDKPVWLKKCVVVPGARGRTETRWNPVEVGAALVRRGHAKANSVRARFQSKPALKPWLDDWKTYEADQLDMP